MDDAYLNCEELTIEKFTNGYDADDANGFPVPTPPDGRFVVGGTQVPLVKIGDPITWTYKVKNNGPDMLVNVEVTDTEGVTVTCPQDMLNPGEEITCMAMGKALSLIITSPNAPIIIDNGDPGYSATVGWETFACCGTGDDFDFT